jgi:hypothetical protein
LKDKVLFKKKSEEQISSAIIGALESTPVQVCQAEDVSFARLIRRSHGKNFPDISNFRIAIVGCGSLGSFLADSLSRSGIQRFLLCDDELLEVGNVGRHVASVPLAGQWKTFALKFTLQQRFEDLQIEECRSDFLSSATLSKIDNFDPHLIVFATGDTNTDLAGSGLVAEGKIASACFAWGETKLTAGHVVFQTRRDTNRLLELHSDPDDQGNYAWRVEKNPTALTEQESGCPTVYSPYSGNDMALFATLVAKRIVGWLRDGGTQSSVSRILLELTEAWESL